jgi:phospholipid/cholesterol/gamma-HCH transport system permease protein
VTLPKLDKTGKESRELEPVFNVPPGARASQGRGGAWALRPFVMASDVDAAESPDFVRLATGGDRRFALSGAWTLAASNRLEQKAAQLVNEARGARAVAIDMTSLARLDTAGAFALNRAREELARAGVAAAFAGARREHEILLAETRLQIAAVKAPARENPLFELLADLGQSIVGGLREAARGVSFLGEFVLAIGAILARPQSFRLTSLVYQMENFAFRAIPIIVLINLAVGAIVAQQGIYELLRFGATAYSVDLIGILVLRELGVLLTSIMVAGRSGSAITAELGSMVVREEIDALRAMGLPPIEVLVAPRILALTLSLPLLTFIADMSALFGGLLVAWVYGGISPAAFIFLLQDAIGLNTFLVGLIKAPFMAIVIGLIAAQDGLATVGSAESLGRQVTSSVVKSIFMVIVVDGIFAIFFTVIHY